MSPNPPTVTLTHKFVGNDPLYVSKAYTVQEIEPLTVRRTSKDGVASFDAPVTLDTATVVFAETGETWTLQIAALNPIDTLSGMFQRLQNMDYIDASAVYDGNNAANNFDVIRAGLFALKADPPTGIQPAPDSSPIGPRFFAVPDEQPGRIGRKLSGRLSVRQFGAFGQGEARSRHARPLAGGVRMLTSCPRRRRRLVFNV